uniref:Iris n=1 Tax=Drosophila pseudoobscura TaxID=7237 RepID=Q30CM1_9MUSC|nr:Iris [Drosophila pseudoobscura]
MSNPTLFIFIFTICIGVSHQAPVDVSENGEVAPMTMTYFNNSLGTFIEHRGRASVIMSEWTIVVYYSLVPLISEIWTFNNNYKLLMKNCDKNPKEFCPRSLQSDLNEMEVASLYRGLSREPDSEYVKYTGSIISRIQDNGVDFRDLLSNQTSVIDSTFNVIRENVFNSNEISSLYFGGQADQLRALGGRIKQTKDAIRDAVFTALHGKVHPMILSNKQLEHEQTVILGHLPQDHRLPFNSLTLSDFYQVATTSHIQQLEQHLLFYIKVPLVDVEQFDVYRLTPIPRLDVGGIQLMYTETSNLAISDHLDRYFALQDVEMDSCLQLHPERYLCKPHQITFGPDSGTLPCTLAAFRNRTSQECSPRHVSQSSLWIPLASPNRWMVVKEEEVSIMGVCSDERQQLRINGSGILTIRSDCIVRSTFVTLQGMQGATARQAYASLRPIALDASRSLDDAQKQHQLEIEEGSSVAIIVAGTLVMIIVSISLGWFYVYCYQRRARAQQVQRPVEDHRIKTKNEGSSNDHPLLERNNVE